MSPILQNAFEDLSTEAKQDVIIATLQALDAELAKDAMLQAVRDRLPAALEGGRLPAASEDSYVRDAYAYHVGNGAIQTLDFGAVYDLIWVKCVGGNGFAKITGNPALDDGIPLEDGIPQPITRISQTVKIWSPNTVKVYGWAYGY